ncbi:MAG: type III secretion system export apparatus subunit SctR [Burkholderiales bacterium]|nr:type III secretion system export apparatus subunit SctR [Burkholderiales bacterium]
MIIFFLSLIPIFIILTTSFIKIAMVLIMARESLGVQQVPPNIVMYAMSLILTFYVMSPVYSNSYQEFTKLSDGNVSVAQITQLYDASSAPLKKFMLKHSDKDDQIYFYNTLQKFWGKEMMKSVKRDDLIVLIPAFMVNELNQGFKIGFLIYLPSIIIDIIVSNILMAMGMQMMSPVTISLPIKLLLFITLGGWTNLIGAIMRSY